MNVCVWNIAALINQLLDYSFLKRKRAKWEGKHKADPAQVTSNSNMLSRMFKKEMIS